MPRRGKRHSPEAVERIRKARQRQEAMKFSRAGLYSRAGRVPAEIQDVANMVDGVIDELVDTELGGPGNVRPSQWIQIATLRCALIITFASTRYAAAKGIIDREKDDLVSVLRHSGGWFDRVGKCLATLGLTRSDGQPAPNVAERLKAIEMAAKQGDNDGSH